MGARDRLRATRPPRVQQEHVRPVARPPPPRPPPRAMGVLVLVLAVVRPPRPGFGRETPSGRRRPVRALRATPKHDLAVPREIPAHVVQPRGGEARPAAATWAPPVWTSASPSPRRVDDDAKLSLVHLGSGAHTSITKLELSLARTGPAFAIPPKQATSVESSRSKTRSGLSWPGRGTRPAMPRPTCASAAARTPPDLPLGGGRLLLLLLLRGRGPVDLVHQGNLSPPLPSLDLHARWGHGDGGPVHPPPAAWSAPRGLGGAAPCLPSMPGSSGLRSRTCRRPGACPPCRTRRRPPAWTPAPRRRVPHPLRGRALVHTHQLPLRPGLVGPAGSSR